MVANPIHTSDADATKQPTIDEAIMSRAVGNLASMSSVSILSNISPFAR